MLAQAQEQNATALVPDDSRFPPALREIPDAPTLLFASGRLELLSTLSLAIVGSRVHTHYGAEVCRYFSGGVARRGITVVSGMARGLDAVAHTAALDVEGGTVGVLGNGHGVIYPSANRRLYQRMADRGCLITEFSPGERPAIGSFQRRNRLISGLARAVVVIEAREKSGTLITVESATEQGRNILAVPGPITSPVSKGCNRLIQDGAKAALGLNDLFEELGIRYHDDVASVSLQSGLSDGERNMLDALALGDAHVDELAIRIAAPSWEALAALTSLEIRGLVAQRPGKIFCRVEHFAGEPG